MPTVVKIGRTRGMIAAALTQILTGKEVLILAQTLDQAEHMARDCCSLMGKNYIRASKARVIKAVKGGGFLIFDRLNPREFNWQTFRPYKTRLEVIVMVDHFALETEVGEAENALRRFKSRIYKHLSETRQD